MALYGEDDDPLIDTIIQDRFKITKVFSNSGTIGNIYDVLDLTENKIMLAQLVGCDAPYRNEMQVLNALQGFKKGKVPFAKI